MKVDTPAIKVVLRKVARLEKGETTRASSSSEVDLTPWLTEDSSVTVSRQINAPSGSFSITLSDRPVRVGDAFDSLYGLVEPMDVVEIRMARRPHEYAPDGLPLVFRGLVSSVSRDEGIGGDGRPRRVVAISGQDFGKFFQITQNRYYRGASNATDWLNNWGVEITYGIPFMTMDSGTFISLFMEKVINETIGRLKSDAIPRFSVDVSGANKADMVFPQGVNALPGGVAWDYLHTFGDLGPFYELFIDDEDAGPKVVYRRPPFLRADGQAVYGSAPEGVIIDPVEVTRLSVSRSDADVSNWWWVENSRLAFIQGQQAIWMNLGETQQNPFLVAPNTDPELYGKRPMEVGSNHGFLLPGADEATNTQQTTDFMAYQVAKRKKLQEANQDNVVFESGQITLAGNERVKVGRGLYITRGGNTGFYYAQSVTHNFQPFRAFTTSVGFIRGTGFVTRQPSEFGPGVRPYLAEIGRGPYEDKR